MGSREGEKWATWEACTWSSRAMSAIASPHWATIGGLGFYNERGEVPECSVPHVPHEPRLLFSHGKILYILGVWGYHWGLGGSPRTKFGGLFVTQNDGFMRTWYEPMLTAIRSEESYHWPKRGFSTRRPPFCSYNNPEYPQDASRLWVIVWSHVQDGWVMNVTCQLPSSPPWRLWRVSTCTGFVCMQRTSNWNSWWTSSYQSTLDMPVWFAYSWQLRHCSCEDQNVSHSELPLSFQSQGLHACIVFIIRSITPEGDFTEPECFSGMCNVLSTISKGSKFCNYWVEHNYGIFV